MAIPPISNNPLLKLFRTDRQGAESKDDQPKQAVKAGEPQARQDIVDISAAAQQRLDGILNLASAEEAQETAAETRAILQEGDDTLGLKPDFS